MNKALAVVGKVFYLLLNIVLALVAIFQLFAAITNPMPLAALNGLVVLAICLYFLFAYKRMKKSKEKAL